MDYHKNYYLQNKQKIKENYNKELKAAYYKNNRDKIIQASKEYNVKNKMKIRSYNIIYNQIHKQELSMKRSMIKSYGIDYYNKVLKESYLNKKYLV
jgi:transposase